jgi:hypothetical protein
MYRVADINVMWGLVVEMFWGGRERCLFTVCVREGARVDVFGNTYTVKEIKVTECSNKSHIQYDISSYC